MEGMQALKAAMPRCRLLTEYERLRAMTTIHPAGGPYPGNVPNLVTNGSRVELEVSNEQLAWDNKNGLKIA
jgi:hypothetical protein